MSVFMFTDIENSSRLWEKHPEVMAKALARHDLILRGQIAAHGGKVIKHLGDGVFAVFETGLPLTCALEIQRQLTDQTGGGSPARHGRETATGRARAGPGPERRQPGRSAARRCAATGPEDRRRIGEDRRYRRTASRPQATGTGEERSRRIAGRTGAGRAGRNGAATGPPAR